jgi:hypothetical protein
MCSGWQHTSVASVDAGAVSNAVVAINGSSAQQPSVSSDAAAAASCCYDSLWPYNH